MRLLVTGAAGMLGHDVIAAAERAGHDVVGLARAELDITSPPVVTAALAEHRPDAVVNCAAWTDVDGAEEHEDQATAVNGDGPRNLAVACETLGTHLVHVSTDYVFAGDATEPYPEDAPCAPIGAYGRSKLVGEQAVAPLAAEGGAAIVRASWLFGVAGPNFVRTMLRLGAERDEVTVVDDQVGNPTYTGHLAEALVQVADERLSGTMHIAGTGACTWFDLAKATFEAAGLDCTVQPGSTADLDRPAPRPLFSVLGRTRSETPVLPPWQDGLSDYLRASAVSQ